MSIHVVNKGKNGEREVCGMLNAEIVKLIDAHTYDEGTFRMLDNVVQRNQNQSAVGGGDINLFGLSIEVKRQETLHVEQWWKQAVDSAARNNDMPVLIYRQNRKAWHVVMPAYLMLPEHGLHYVRATISVEDFLAWFYKWVEKKIAIGEVERV